MSIPAGASPYVHRPDHLRTPALTLRSRSPDVLRYCPATCYLDLDHNVLGTRSRTSLVLLISGPDA